MLALRCRSKVTYQSDVGGQEKNIYHLEDERCTEYIDRAEKDGLITTRRIPNILNEGEK